MCKIIAHIFVIGLLQCEQMIDDCRIFYWADSVPLVCRINQKATLLNIG